MKCSNVFIALLNFNYLGMKLDRRIEEAVPAAQQLQELGMRLRCDDNSSDQVSNIILLQFVNRDEKPLVNKYDLRPCLSHWFGG